MSLLLLHSFVPHQHHNEIGDSEHLEEHANSDSPLDYLGLIFHENLGENHLEEFQNAESHFDLATCHSPLPVSLHIKVFADFHRYFHAESEEADPKTTYLKGISKRGPPTA